MSLTLSPFLLWQAPLRAERRATQVGDKGTKKRAKNKIKTLYLLYLFLKNLEVSKKKRLYLQRQIGLSGKPPYV